MTKAVQLNVTCVAWEETRQFDLESSMDDYLEVGDILYCEFQLLSVQKAFALSSVFVVKSEDELWTLSAVRSLGFGVGDGFCRLYVWSMEWYKGPFIRT